MYIFVVHVNNRFLMSVTMLFKHQSAGTKMNTVPANYLQYARTQRTRNIVNVSLINTATISYSNPIAQVAGCRIRGIYNWNAWKSKQMKISHEDTMEFVSED